MYKIMHGDCLELMKDIPDGSIDMVLTDIPYGCVNRDSNGLRVIDKGIADVVSFDVSEMAYQLVRVSRGSGYIFCGDSQISELKKIMVDKKLSHRVCVWRKTNPSPMNGTKIWLSGVEFCIYFKKPKSTFNERCKNVVWDFPTQQGKLHPTMKPLKLMEYLIKVSSNENQTVFDPFMGSGSTGIACLNTNRKFIGIEKDDHYFNVAKNRIEEHQLSLQMRIN